MLPFPGLAFDFIVECGHSTEIEQRGAPLEILFKRKQDREEGGQGVLIPLPQRLLRHRPAFLEDPKMSQQTIGLTGGTSPESTVLYYQYLTGEYVRRHGDFGFPEILIYSIRFQELLDWGRAERWDRVAEKMASVCNALQAAGAHFGLMTANTLHKVFDQVAERTRLPLLSILEATAEEVQAAGFRRVGLLGTATTMRGTFYPEALGRRGIEAFVPDEADLETASRIIYDELTRGIVTAESRATYLRILRRLGERGCEGVILGCTELPMVLSQQDTSLRLFDTTRIHAEAALRRATGEPAPPRGPS